MNRGDATVGGSYMLTGATGFLGSHVMAGLLNKGERVVIVGRPAGRESLAERIRRLLGWFGIKHCEGQLEFHEIDFLKPRLGLGADDYERLRRRGLPIIHCASDTSFAEKKRTKVMRSNVESLNELLNFAEQSRTSYFHLVSSVYAAGTDSRECPEALVNSAHFNNVYEESKAQAEHVVSARCRSAGLFHTIIRPSIVYGDSLTGRSLRFNALYFPVRSLQSIRDIYFDEIKNHQGIKAAECGIHLDEKGVLHLPIRIFIPHEGKINLIPVNYFTETVLSILENPLHETIYHVTSNHPQSMAGLASYTERFLEINGIEVVIGTAASEKMRNPPEELFDHFIRAYRPYISDQRTFKRENTDRVTGGLLPPDFSYEIFQKCMAFAVAADWGKKIFQ
ncbi:MAG: SDR family oxidoreductase [Chrysiogenia bacterium]